MNRTTAMRTLLSLALFLALTGCSGALYEDAEPLAFEELDYGFPVETALDNPEVAYVDVGEGPETLLLVHGLASNAGFWRYNIPGLAEDYRVVAVDLPGYGRSEKGAYPYTMSFFADVLGRLIERLDLGPVVYVGHSMGGQIGLTLALRHPEHIERLILAAPAGLEAFDEGEGHWLANALTTGAIEHTSEPAIRRNLAANFYEWDDRWEWMVEERARLAQADDFEEFAYAVVRSVHGMIDEPTTPYLGQGRVPTHIIYGRYDGLIPNPYLNPGFPADVFEEGAERIPNAELTEVDEAGHLLQIERPEAFNEAVLEYLRADRPS